MSPKGIPPKTSSPPLDETPNSPEAIEEATPQPATSVNSSDSFEDLLHEVPSSSSISSSSSSSTSLDSGISSTSLDSEPDEPPKGQELSPPQTQTLQEQVETLGSIKQASVVKQYKLGKQATQTNGTNQCWWLSFLECLRGMEKLDDVFTRGPLANSEPPKAMGRLVYGPRWQRAVMGHLNKQTGKDTWYKSKDTVPVRDRAEQLERLMGLLGITGVSVKAPISVVPTNIEETMRQLEVGQRVLVDKDGHAMSGVVKLERVKKAKGAGYENRKIIRVHNQATRNHFSIWPRKDKDELLRLKSPAGTSINYIIPLLLKPPDEQ